MAKGFEIAGVDDVQKMLNRMAPRESRNLMRTTIHGVAGEIAKGSKRNAPSESGTLKKAIKTKRKKSHPDRPMSDVIVTTGNSAKHDAFYWRFVEYGTGGGKGSHLSGTIMPNAHPFIRPAADAVRANMEKILVKQFGKKLEQKLAREAKKRAGK